MILSYSYKFLDNGEKVLVLYMDNDSLEEELSLEWLDNFKNKTWKDFLRKNSVIWEGFKVILVVGGVTLAVLHNPVSTSSSYPEFVTENTFATSVIVDDNLGNVDDNENGGIILDDVIKEEIGEDSSENDISDKNDITNKNQISEIEKPSVNNNSNNNSNSNVGNNDIVESVPDNKEDNGDISEKEEDVPSKDEEKEDILHDVVVYRSNGVIVELSMEDYLIGVVAAEMPASFNIESLKAQSILARTYALKRMSAGLILTDTVQTQRYIDESEMRNAWGSSFNKYYEKIKSAVDETKDMVVLYQGQLIDAVYHSTSNGFTEDSKNVWGNKIPYLVSVDSSWDRNVGSYLKKVSFSDAKLLSLFGVSKDSLAFEILNRNASGRVQEVRVGDKIYSGVEFREVLGLRSSDFDLSYDGEELVVTTRGYGHGVGLSQYGANEMAKSGKSYSDIIRHYYKGVNISKK